MAGLEMPELGRVENAGGASGGASSSTGSAMDDVALDIDTLFEKVKQQQRRMERTPARDGQFLIISRVREPTRNVRPDEYTPHYVPIGPYHWSQRRIDEKRTYLNIILDAYYKNNLSSSLRNVHISTEEDDKKVLLGNLLQAMKNLDASSCYSDGFDGMGAENEFHMLLLDGCYLLACFADSLYRLNNNVTTEAPQEEEEPPPPRTESATGAPTASTESASGVVAASVNDGKVPPKSNRWMAWGQKTSFTCCCSTGAAEEQQVDGMAAPTARTEGASGKVRDILYLLENQIPFFVVQKIYELVTRESPPSAVLTMFKAHVKKLLQDQLYIGETKETPPSDPSHLLHLVRTYFPEPKVEGGASSGTGWWHRAMEYCSYANVRFHPRELNNDAAPAEGGASASSGTGRWHRAMEYCSYANVRFHPRKLDNDAASSVLDVSLAGGKLLVPLLRVDNDTWTILRNLMALEEHHAESLERHVTAYCLFMSQLACTEEDVALLVRRRVVEHFLGSDSEVAAGFADLCKGVVLNVDDPNSNYLKPVWHELERRYRSRWQNLVALFRQTHGRNLLYAAAFVVAVILFASQVLQGIFTIMGYYQK